MVAILGAVLSYAALVSGLSGAGASAQVDICAAGAGTCQESQDDAATDGDPAGAWAQSGYASPVEVDCSAPPGDAGQGTATDRDGVADGCAIPAPVLDLHYRVSRFADSERPAGSLGPQRGRRATLSSATCRGLPPDHGNLVSASVSPIAIYALTGLAPPKLVGVALDREQRAPTRVVEPLDRPPRA